MNHYECHVRYDANDGYSAYFESRAKLETREDIIQHAVFLEEIQPDHAILVDYATALTEEEYDAATAGETLLPPESAPSEDTVTLELRIPVTFKLNGASVSDMKTQLSVLVDHAANHGLFTGETPAEVETFSSEIVRRI